MKKYIIFFGILSVIIIISFIWGKRRTNDIKNNKQLTTGQITGFQNLHKPTAYDLKFTCTVAGITYKNISSETTIAPNNYSYFVGKYFPVVYSKVNPKRCEILIFPSDFEAWNIPFPDSLKWVKQYDYF